MVKISILIGVVLLLVLVPGTARAATLPTGSSFAYTEADPQGWLGFINLSTGSPACAPERKVKLYRKRPGRDPLIGSDVSGRPAHDGEGYWFIQTRLRPGKYYAKIKRKRISGGDICAAFRTSTLRYPAR